MNFDVPYAITKRLSATTIDDVRPKVEAALKAEGFGVLTEIDVQATLEKKLGVQTTPYLILGACNPQLAHQAISGNPALGLMLPCNVVLAADGGDVVVSAASPKAMFSITSRDPTTAQVAEHAEERIRRAVAAL
jgi:uncharacterized protein (DUF302 family)